LDFHIPLTLLAYRDLVDKVGLSTIDPSEERSIYGLLVAIGFRAISNL